MRTFGATATSISVSAITSAAVRDAFAHGCGCVFLTAGDETAQRVYARLGFQIAGMGMATMDPLPVPDGEWNADDADVQD